ncbi:MAG: hypothetical protein M1839_004508 [Geoglossum umbratile]|nr:MAG: hypothetical protein M1839_004508 [Geoglossum umbratile]
MTAREDVINEFKIKLGEYKVKAVCGRHYILVGELKEWLRSKQGSDSRIELLLGAAYRDSTGPGFPITSEKVSETCLLVFSILLELDLGNLIHRFSRANITDARIPLSLLTLRERLKANAVGLTDDDAERIAQRFNELQWAFCPVRFELDMAINSEKSFIIPVCKKDEIGKGGTARVWMIMVRAEFVGDKLKALVPDSGFDDPTHGPCYQFALKTFEEGNKRFFDAEKTAFDGLRTEEGVVRYLGDYSHEEIRSSENDSSAERKDVIRTTHNIVLEYGESDLSLYFGSKEPPVLQSEIEGFWEELFDVAHTIGRMHNLKLRIGGVVQEYYGYVFTLLRDVHILIAVNSWHADIKPDNILTVRGKFKLADPGFAKFERRGDKGLKQILEGGTETYGAPESHLGRRGASGIVTQSIDIWSLGCVFSIAASWVVLGYPGIPQFHKMRQNAIDKLVAEQNPGSSTRNGVPSLIPGDYFHDGEKVLADVLEWHKFLRNGLRKTDTITDRVLNLIEGKMLLVGEKRVSAENLCNDLGTILAQSRSESRIPTPPETIIEALLEVDNEAPPNLTQPSLEAVPGMGQLSSDRKTLKSRLLVSLKKTTHRTQYLKSALHSAQTARPQAYSVMGKGAPGQRRHDSGISFSPLHASAQLPNPDSDRGMSVAPPTPTLAKTKSEMFVADTYQNVFQAREAIEKREKGNFLRQTRKDKLLSEHFKDRDIKFIVDNAKSMRRHWYEATYLLETLVRKAAGQDTDGMDLTFTSGSARVERGKSASKFREAMQRDDVRPNDSRVTDVRSSLGTIFKDYEMSKGKVKDLTIIILTDGKWEGVRDKYEVDNMVIQFGKKLKGYRPVGIEFVQFGNDRDATYRLRRLDMDLKWQGVPDIVDTEPSSGNINKMLLGSFVELFDELDEDYIDETPTSPNPSEGHSRLPSR